MNGYCVYCGDPHPSIFVFTDEKGEERFVHDHCYRGYTQRLLRQDVTVREYDDDD